MHREDGMRSQMHNPPFERNPTFRLVVSELSTQCWGALTTRVLRRAVDIVANLTSPSGCAVDGRYAFVVEQGSTDGELVRVALTDDDAPGGAARGSKTVLLGRLAGPMGGEQDFGRRAQLTNNASPPN
jgi:hypothetical protein